MNFKILKQTTGEPLGALELHVLAKAYHAAWRRIYGSEPIRGHAIPSLDVLIDFGALDPDRRDIATQVTCAKRKRTHGAIF